MKRLIATFLISIVLIGCSAFQQDTNDINKSAIADKDTVTFQTPSKEIDLIVEIADTKAERTKGLMYREHMGENDGMLFIFEIEKPQTFWMKDTLISLDMIFINSEFEIVHIAKNTKPNQIKELYSSQEPARYVIETNAGWTDQYGILVGQVVKF